MNGIAPADQAILQALREKLEQLPPDQNGFEEARKISLKDYQVARRCSYELSTQIHQKFGLEEHLEEIEKKYPGLLGRINRLSDQILKFVTVNTLRHPNTMELDYLFQPDEKLMEGSVHHFPTEHTSQCIVHYRLNQIEEERPDLVEKAKTQKVESSILHDYIFMSVGKWRTLSPKELRKYAKKLKIKSLSFLTDNQIACLPLDTLSTPQINAALAGPTESKRSFLRRYNRISNEMRDLCATQLNYEHLQMLDRIAIEELPIERFELATLKAHFGGAENRERFSWLTERQILKAIDKLICCVGGDQIPDAVIQKIEPDQLGLEAAPEINRWPYKKIHLLPREVVYHLRRGLNLEQIQFLSPKQQEEYFEDIRNHQEQPELPKKGCVVQ